MEDQTNSLGVAARIRVRAFCRTIDPCHERWHTVLMYLAVASISLAIMVLTEPFLTIVWDEGYSLGREARVRTWFGALRDPVAFAERWQPPVEELVPPNR